MCIRDRHRYDRLHPACKQHHGRERPERRLHVHGYDDHARELHGHQPPRQPHHERRRDRGGTGLDRAMMSLLRDSRGLTLAEVLIAAAILALGLAALMSVVPVASYAVQDGNQTSTATFLGQQRLEQVRNATWNAITDCVGLSPNASSPPAPSPAGTCGATAVTFPDEATLSGFAQYARTAVSYTH